MWQMCQMPNIWHICHTKHKKYLPSDMLYMPKLYHFCPYRCKFATVWTEMVNRNIVFYSIFSLLSLTSGLDFFSLLTSDPAPSHIKERTKCGDRVWVTVEIGFGYGSRWRLCLRSVLGFSCLSLFSSLGFSSGGSWCFSGGAVA